MSGIPQKKELRSEALQYVGDAIGKLAGNVEHTAAMAAYTRDS